MTQLGRLDEAEPVLSDVVEEYPFTAPSLAWLYERRGDLEEAIRILEEHCSARPEDRFAAGQLERLRARSLDLQRLQEELETLLDLGEEIPLELLAGHVEGLLKTGQGPRVRELVASVRSTLDRRTALRIAGPVTATVSPISPVLSSWNSSPAAFTTSSSCRPWRRTPVSPAGRRISWPPTVSWPAGNHGSGAVCGGCHARSPEGGWRGVQGTAARR